MRAEIRKSARQRTGLRPRRRRREEAAGQAHERPASEASAPAAPLASAGGPEARPIRPEERERRTGGPQDKALFVCRCGSAFQAQVTASVRCPHCGDPQAW